MEEISQKHLETMEELYCNFSTIKSFKTWYLNKYVNKPEL